MTISSTFEGAGKRADIIKAEEAFKGILEATKTVPYSQVETNPEEMTISVRDNGGYFIERISVSVNENEIVIQSSGPGVEDGAVKRVGTLNEIKIPMADQPTSKDAYTKALSVIEEIHPAFSAKRQEMRLEKAQAAFAGILHSVEEAGHYSVIADAEKMTISLKDNGGYFMERLKISVNDIEASIQQVGPYTAKGAVTAHQAVINEVKIPLADHPTSFHVHTQAVVIMCGMDPDFATKIEQVRQGKSAEHNWDM